MAITFSAITYTYYTGTMYTAIQVYNQIINRVLHRRNRIDDYDYRDNPFMCSHDAVNN